MDSTNATRSGYTMSKKTVGESLDNLFRKSEGNGRIIVATLDCIITVVIAIDRVNKIIISGPDIVTREFVYVRESEQLIMEIRRIVTKSVERRLDNNKLNG